MPLLLIDALLKVTLLLAAAALATMALNRASAAVRHLIWTLALVGALLLPILSIALPRWQLPLITLQNGLAISTELADRTESAPNPTVTAAPSVRPLVERTPNLAPRAPKATAPVAASPVAAAPDAAVRSSSLLPKMSPMMWLLAIWAGGAALVIGRMFLGLVAVHWMSRRTARVVDAPWLPLAVELASDLGISRRLTFVESRSATMPMAWGLLRPSVMMPADAVRWPVERLRIVLLHELAHVKRRDCLTHVVVQLACAAYWFNPLAWIAARRIRTERERACDDLVLAAGTRGPDYAEELLEIARVMRAGRFPSIIAGATLAMAHRTQLEGRLIAILDPKVPRTGVSPVRTVAAIAVAVCALLPLASMQPWSVAEAAPSSVAAPEPASSSAAPEPQRATPAPPPNPQPNPRPRPEIADVPAAVEAVVAEAVTEATRAIPKDLAKRAAESATEAVVQGVTHAAVQDAVQSAVQGAVQGAMHGAWAVQEGRKPADPRTIAALTAALKDSDKEVRETAMHALVRLRDPSVFEPLVQALKDPSADMREQAVHGLSQLRDRRAAEPLLGMLQDPNPGVREAVVHALVQFRDPRAIDGLIVALKDDSASVREQAAHGLGQFRDPRAVDPLIATLKDQNAGVREQAVHALSQLRDKRATVAIAALIKDQNPGVREQAVHALGQLRDSSSVEGLIVALRDTNAGVREQAVHALSQIRDPRAGPAFIAALKDDNPDVRKQAAWGLGQLRDRTAVEALIIALKDSNADVREQVAWALGQLGDPRAIDALTTALKDANAEVRRQVAWALGQLAGR